MSSITVPIPDLGGAEEVELIEVCVAIGDQVTIEQSLVVLESDKASMEVPSPLAGRVSALHLTEGTQVSVGMALLDLEVEEGSPAGIVETQTPAPTSVEALAEPVATDTVAESTAREPDTPQQSATPSQTRRELVSVPDLSGAEEVRLVEVCVAVGDSVEIEQSLVILESDKASMEVPSPWAGRVVSVHVQEGASDLRAGQPLVELECAAVELDAKTLIPPVASSAEQTLTPPATAVAQQHSVARSASPRAEGVAKSVYAGPAVRRMARELGVELHQLAATGPRGRILKEDLQRYVRQALRDGGRPAVPAVDFAAFGEVELRPMSRIHRATARNMAASWAHVPHVTQLDEVDVTELEALRSSLKPEMERRGVRLTPVVFLLRSLARALSAHPAVNASLHADGRTLVCKRYVHIGIAVDTPTGLVVPVLRDADRKDLWALGEELMALATDAREGRLSLSAMQGGSFTLSSLGAIGGRGFTPIVNAPQTAILGVGRLDTRPVYVAEALQPRQLLPLSLSYDHRVINGAEAGRFFCELIEDLARPPAFHDNGDESQPPPAFKTTLPDSPS